MWTSTHVFSAWGDIAQRLKAARRVLMLSDYDGTLTPIVESPEKAIMPEPTRELIRSLARQSRLTVGIISGRALGDLQTMVGIRGIVYAGNHGLEIEGPGWRFIAPLADEFRPVLRLLHRVLSRALSPVSGAVVEDKGLSLTVHYRQVEDGRAVEVGNIFERIVAAARSEGRLKTTTGKRVYEVRPPVAWDKGKAVNFLLEKFGPPGGKHQALPVFLGDDLTDEDAFKAVEKRNGISVYVGEENLRSAARYYVKSPEEAQEFLRRVLELYENRT